GQKILLCEGPPSTNAQSYWVTIQKNGIRSTYGRRSAANSKLLGNGFVKGSNGAIVPSSEAACVYYLDEVTNPHGLSWQANYSAYGDGVAGSSSAPRLLYVQYTF